MGGGIMVDYAKLADAAKVKQDAGRWAADRHKQLIADPSVFFGRVKAHLLEEMRKANVELRKRKGGILDQNHLPGFPNEMFLTYGTDSLCRVGLGTVEGGCRVTAIISGPPNGYEISRREYLCDQPAACQEVLPDGGRAVPCRPDEIAVDIISGILRGKFD
jgi:hypothetical protein